MFKEVACPNGKTLHMFVSVFFVECVVISSESLKMLCIAVKMKLRVRKYYGRGGAGAWPPEKK